MSSHPENGWCRHQEKAGARPGHCPAGNKCGNVNDRRTCHGKDNQGCDGTPRAKLCLDTDIAAFKSPAVVQEGEYIFCRFGHNRQKLGGQIVCLAAGDGYPEDCAHFPGSPLHQHTRAGVAASK